MTEGESAPLAEPIAEGRRLAEAAALAEVPMRLVGGVAVAILCPSSRRRPLARRYADIDFASTGAVREKVVHLMDSLGYRGDEEFNMLHGHRRLTFWDERNRRQVDLFLDEANLCHRIPLKERIGISPLTLPLADLTLLKLQVVETNEKDYLDICAIFADHDLSEGDSGINTLYIGELAASDWGLWRTLGMVAERSERFALALPDFGAREVVAERLRRLREVLDEVPKTRAWKLRSRIGDRKRWYELPEEVN